MDIDSVAPKGVSEWIAYIFALIVLPLVRWIHNRISVLEDNYVSETDMQKALIEIKQNNKEALEAIYNAVDEMKQDTQDHLKEMRADIKTLLSRRAK